MNKTLKKVLCAVMALVMLFAFTACDNDEDMSSGKSSDEISDESRGADTIEELFEKYTEILDEDADVEAMIRKLYTPYTWNEKGMVREIVLEKVEATRDELKEKCGKDVTATMKVISEEEIVGGSLDELQGFFKEDGYEVEAAKRVIAGTTVKGELDEYYCEESVVVVKHDGKWYLRDY